ncbi:MAG TPA: lysophospholipid acyltransferase family protein [Oleiagrimonas sp.]|nr:lysophospholipid acyltransferase family protein [Oleiagrimonas sp.]
MNMPEQTMAPRSRDWWRPVRYLYRIPLVVLLLILGVLLCLFVAGPRRHAVARGGREPLAHRATRWWSTMLMRVFGFRVSQVGSPLPDAAMFVCNHVTWLDIVLVHTQRAACFVAKAEIARWPVVGWMAACGGTIFHQRGSNQSMATVMDTMVKRLQKGRSVAVFPEGGTSHGGKLRTFHARIFQAALDAETPVQPVALRYARHGRRWLDVAFRPGESFVANIVRLMGEPSCDAEVHFLPPVPPNEAGRRRMAEQARERIAAALDGGVEGRQ